MNNTQKRFEVIIFNQNYNPPSSLDILRTDGISGLIPSFDSVISFRGISVLVFFAFCILLMMSNSICKDIKIRTPASKTIGSDDGELSADLTDVIGDD